MINEPMTIEGYEEHLKQQGLVIVPLEPTDEMIDAGVDARAQLFAKQGFTETGPKIVLVANHPAGTIYKAMIDKGIVSLAQIKSYV